MSKTLLVLVICISLAAWRAAPYLSEMASSLPGTDAPPQATAAEDASMMTTPELLELSKKDPKAFDAYVMAHINDPPPHSETSKEEPGNKPIPLAEILKQGKGDQMAVTALLSSRTKDDKKEQHTPLEKLFNLLSHGKYE